MWWLVSFLSLLQVVVGSIDEAHGPNGQATYKTELYGSATGTAFDDFSAGARLPAVITVESDGINVVQIETFYSGEETMTHGVAGSESTRLNLRSGACSSLPCDSWTYDFVTEIKVQYCDDRIYLLSMTTRTGKSFEHGHSGGCEEAVIRYDDPAVVLRAFFGRADSVLEAIGFYFDHCNSCSKGERLNLYDNCECEACDPGSISDGGTTTTCEPCGPGEVPNPERSECVQCSAGKYADVGDLTCLDCNMVNFDPSQRGATSLDDCRCADGWTADDCSIPECPSTLALVSLGLLLVEASFPEELRKSHLNATDRAENKISTGARIEAILRTADLNGDDALSVDEVLIALEGASVRVATDDSDLMINAWSFCTDEKTVEKKDFDEVTVSDMILDAVTNFIASGTFYGADFDVAAPSKSKDAIISMTATYPDTKFTELQCRCFRDPTATASQIDTTFLQDCDVASISDLGGIDLEWTYRPPESDDSPTTTLPLHRQCAYVNGALMDESIFTKSFTDGSACADTTTTGEKTCQFHDGEGVGDGSRKRLYCIRQDYCKTSDCTSVTTKTRCTTGLAFDGAPADVVPYYRPFEGVKFQFLDTSLDEVGFRIFRTQADANEVDTNYGQLIMDVPVKSKDCGQQFSPLSFADGDVGAFPASRVEYVVATVDEDGGVANATRIRYTSPWVTTLTVTVMTETGGPVADVAITVEHLQDSAIVSDSEVDPNFKLALVTNLYGEAVREIRVTDPTRWQSITQHLRITPRFCENGDDTDGSCTGGLLHEFSVASEDIGARHLFEAAVEFIDVTAVTISGYVIFGEGDALGWRYPGYFGNDWTTTVTEGCPENPYDLCCPYTLIDRCYCPVPDVKVEIIDLEDGKVDEVDVEDDGTFTTTVGRGRSVKVRFAGYEGHTFSLWHPRSWNLVDDDDPEVWDTVPQAEFPELQFDDITTDQLVLIVDEERGDFDARIVAGVQDLHFITGQRIRIRRDECMYERDVVVEHGRVSNVELPMTSSVVEIPNDDDNIDKSRPPDCLETPAANPDDPSYWPDTACRVEAPIFTSSNDGRLACYQPSVVDKGPYIDQYFNGRPDRQVTIDFLLGPTQEAIFRYVGHLCMVKITVGPARDTDLFPIPVDLEDYPDDGDERRYIREDGVWIPWSEDRDEAFLKNFPTIQSVDEEQYPFGYACTSNDEAVLVEGDQVSMKFYLAEVYPIPKDFLGTVCHWPWSFFDDDLDICTRIYNPPAGGGFNEDKLATVPTVGAMARDAILISVLDDVSGTDEQIDAFTYNVTLSGDCDPLSHYADKRDDCFGYELVLHVADPNPFVPFEKGLEVTAHRQFDDSKIKVDRNVVVLGVIPEDVPQVFTMATDPTLIYGILRDPPGGASSTTLAKGSILSTSINFDGMHAASRSQSQSLGINANLRTDVGLLTAPLGFGLQSGLVKFNYGTTKSYGGEGPSINMERGAKQGFDLEFAFDIDISTSNEVRSFS